MLEMDLMLESMLEIETWFLFLVSNVWCAATNLLLMKMDAFHHYYWYTMFWRCKHSKLLCHICKYMWFSAIMISTFKDTQRKIIVTNPNIYISLIDPFQWLEWLPLAVQCVLRKLFSDSMGTTINSVNLFRNKGCDI